MDENKFENQNNDTNENTNEDIKEDINNEGSDETVNNENNNNSENFNSDSNNESYGGYNDYYKMHEPINFDTPNVNEVRKKNPRKLIITIGIIFAAMMLLLAFALIYEISLATEDDIKGDIKVNISISEKEQPPLEDGSATAESLENFKNSVVIINADSSTGSGIIFSSEGNHSYIVTNYHVIENASSINVTLYSEDTYKASVVGYIEDSDIAVIEINARNLTPADFNTEDCYLGQRVYAVGNPAGSSFAWSVTSGIVSAPLREAKFYDESNKLSKIMNVIQTDTAVNPGNSGGPLINANCEVVGIITMRLANDYTGMGFAIPSNEAVRLIGEIFKNANEDTDTPEETKTPQMGIVGVDTEKGNFYYVDTKSGVVHRVSDSFVLENPDKCFSPAANGIYIIKLSEGFDAEGKLKVGDVIVDIESTGFCSMNYLGIVIKEKKVGDTVKVKVNRDGEILEFEIILK